MPSADLIPAVLAVYGNSIDNDDSRIFESETVTVKLGHALFGNILVRTFE